MPSRDFANEDVFSSPFVADKYGRAGDELAHLVLALATERAMERFLGFAAADLVHQNPDKIQVITARNAAGQTRLTHDREGQPRAGDTPASSIIEEASENP